MSDSGSTAPHAEVVPGSTIGPWRVRERRERGSFGLIFRVERAGHPEAGSFALKLALTPDDPRFKREVALLESLQHPAVPRFEDRGWWDSPSSGAQYPYLVMEWVDGVQLYEWARGTRRTSREVLHILGQLASALAAAHAFGGVHRDVKGDNVLVTSEGRAVLLDWGCAVHLGAKPVTESSLGPGTSAYRSPESLRWHWEHRLTGERYEPKGSDDVYALGVTAYRLCTGTYPPMPEEASGPPVRLFSPRELATVSAGLDELLLTCLGEEPLRRPPAASLVIALGHAARQSEAAAPILSTLAAADTYEASPGRVLPEWFPSAAAAAATLALVVLAAHALLSRDWSRLWETRGSPTSEAPDAGVGDQALTSAEQGGTDISPIFTIGRQFPKQPWPNQKKPPCMPRIERELIGACWSILKATPPCGEGAFDKNGECLRPVVAEQRPNASEDPQ